MKYGVLLSTVVLTIGGLVGCGTGHSAMVPQQSQPRSTNDCLATYSAHRATNVRGTQETCDDSNPIPAGDGFVDPEMSLGLSDPEIGFGSLDAVAPPSGSNLNPDGSYTDPNGNRWIQDPATGQWYMVIGSTGTRAWPVIVTYGGTVDLTPGGGVATLKPTAGQTCGSGFSSLPLGSDLPPQNGVTGDLQIINIFELYEPASFASNPGAAGGSVMGGSVIVGYVYVTVSGQYFVQSTGADGNFFSNLLSQVPVLGPALNNTTTGTISPPLTPQQANALFGDYKVKQPGKGALPCFTAPLPVSQWT